MNLSRHTRYLLLIAAATLSLQSCSNCINGSGNTTTQSRTLTGYSEVSFSCDDDGAIYIAQTPTSSFSVQAQQNIIDDLQTDISGDELLIYNQHCLRNNPGVIVNINTPILRALSLTGEGEMNTANKIISDQMAITCSGTGTVNSGDSIVAPAMSTFNSGSGTINALVSCNTMSSTNTGSGTITINGIGDSQSLNSSGSGDFHAYGFITNVANIAISGSSDVELYVNDSLEVTISGSGNVYYKGNAVVNTHLSGSGQVIHVN